MNLKENILLLSLLICSFQLSFQAHANEFPFLEKAKISKLPSKQRAYYHKKMTQLLISIESKTRYPIYRKSKYSLINLFDKSSQFLILQAIAEEDSNENGACLFGGWLSHRNGRCSVPWSNNSVSLANSQQSNSYDSRVYCGADDLFRCNPIVFGPGIDSQLITDSNYSRINGEENKNHPYRSGICVDISNGYEGLSQKCEQASNHLDEIRKENGMPPWRESGFFDQEVASQFDALQSVAFNKCKENRDALNADNMCTSLESSLGLTYSALLAGDISDFKISEFFSQCEDIDPEIQNQCDQTTPEELENLNDAIKSLSSNMSCHFSNVSVIDKESYQEQTEPTQCQTTIGGKLLTDGMGPGENEIIFSFTDTSGKVTQIEALITNEMTNEDIYASITARNHSSEFNSICNQSTCPQSDIETLSPLYQTIDAIQAMPNCNFGSIGISDQESAQQEHFTFPECSKSISGVLANEGATSATNIAINVRDSEGNKVGTISTNYDPSRELGTLDPGQEASEGFLNSIREDLMSLCSSAADANRTGTTSALSDLAVSDDVYVPASFTNQNGDNLAVQIKNQLERDGVDINNIHLEFLEDGSIKLSAEMNEQERSTIVNSLSKIPNLIENAQVTHDSTGVHIRHPTVMFETLAHQANITLNQQERDYLTDINQVQGIFPANLSRAENGDLIFSDSQNPVDYFSLTSTNGEIVISNYQNEEAQVEYVSAAANCLMATENGFCGNNNVSYLNSCILEASGTTIKHEGVCEGDDLQKLIEESRSDPEALEEILRSFN